MRRANQGKSEVGRGEAGGAVMILTGKALNDRIFEVFEPFSWDRRLCLTSNSSGNIPVK